MARTPSAPPARVRRRLLPLRWLGAAGLLAWSCVTPASAAILHVDLLATGADDGSSWADAFVDLQDAFAAATVGDEIWVSQGTYRPTAGLDRAATFQLKSGVSVYGGFSGVETGLAQRDRLAHPTILSGDIGIPDESVFREYLSLVERRVRGKELTRWARRQQTAKRATDNSYHVVTGSGTDDTAVLDGFTVTRGAAEGPGIDGDGGGLLNVAGSPTLNNLVFLANTAAGQGGGIANHAGSAPKLTNVQMSNWSGYVGGGMFNDASDPVLDEVLFEANVAAVGGGAMHNRGGSAPVLADVDFAGNAVDEVGGGMDNVGSSPSLSDVTFVDNFAGGAGGGGMANRAGSSPTLSDVTFDGNLASTSVGGGGMLNQLSHPTLTNVLFTGNITGAEQGGGGMVNYGANPVLTGVAFFQNSALAYGGGLANYAGSKPKLINVTFSHNFTNFGGGWGGAVYSDHSTPVLVNCILWNDASGPGREEIANDSSVPIVSSSIVGNSGGSEAWDASLGLNGGGNLDVDPLFVDGAGGDLRLDADSPAVDTGLSGVVASAFDLGGDPRVSGSAVDLGAYESSCASLNVVFGASTTESSLQDVLDAAYGVGEIDAEEDHLAALCDLDRFPYWFDGVDQAYLFRVLAADGVDEFGWYVENLKLPAIDGTDDGIILDVVITAGASGSVVLPGGHDRFGFYLNPNGPGGAAGAPEPEVFFLNRVYNDAGPDGSGDLRPPDGGDPQCLVYDVSRFHHDRPAFVLAWEGDDYGVTFAAARDSLATHYLFQDLVIEVRSMLPIAAVTARLVAAAVSTGVELRWTLEGAEALDRLELRRTTRGLETTLMAWPREEIVARGAWVDAHPAPQTTYRLVGIAAGLETSSLPVAGPPPWEGRPRLLGASPNPFNPSTRVAYSLPTTQRVTLAVFDVSGRKVRQLVAGTRVAGDHAVTWDGRDEGGGDVASGVYTVHLRAGSTFDTQRVVLLK